MKTIITSLAALFLFALSAHAFRTTVITGDRVIEQTFQSHGLDSQAEVIKLVTVDRYGNTGSREVLRLAKTDDDGNTYMLLYFLAPDEVAGTILLTHQLKSGTDEQFLYLPGLGSPRRIMGEAKTGNFLGTDFAFEDLLKEDMDDFEYELLNEDVVDGLECYNVIAYPTLDYEDSTNYSKRNLWVTKEDSRIVRIELYNWDDRLVKTLRFTDFKVADNGRQSRYPVKATMENRRMGTYSVIVIKKGKYGEAIPQKFFDKNVLKNWPTEMKDEALALAN